MMDINGKYFHGWREGEHFMLNIYGKYFQQACKANLSIP